MRVVKFARAGLIALFIYVSPALADAPPPSATQATEALAAIRAAGQSVEDGAGGMGGGALGLVFGEQLARAAFGRVPDGQAPAAAVVIHSAMAGMSIIAMALVPAILGWTGLVLMFGAMQSGEPFGRKYSAAWLPARAAGGLIVAAPLPGLGVSTIQLGVLALAFVGSAVGDRAAETVTQAAWGGRPLIAASVSSADPTATVESYQKIAAGTACVAAGQRAGYGYAEIEQWCRSTEVRLSDPVVYEISSGITGSGPAVEAAELTQACAGSTYPATCREVRRVRSHYERKLRLTAQTNAAEETARRRAEAEAAGRDPASVASAAPLLTAEQHEELASEYAIAVAGAISGTAGERIAQARGSTKALGWPGLGLWFTRISSQQAELSDYVNPDRGPALRDLPKASHAGQFVAANTIQATERARAAAENGWQSVKDGNGGGLWRAIRDYVSAAVDGIKAIPADAATAAGTGASWLQKTMFYAIFDSNNSVETVVGMGHLAQGTGVGLMTLGVVGEAAGAAAKSAGEQATPVGGAIGGAVGEIASKLGGAAIAVGLVLFVLGGFLAQVVPALPVILGGLLLVEWLTFIVIAAVASPLWAVSHAMPDGDGIAPRSSVRGWQLLAYIAAFPLLFVCGVTAAIVVFNVAVPLLSGLIWAIVPEGSLSALGQVAGKLVLLGVVVAVVSYQSMRLILATPGQIAEWLGISPANAGVAEHAANQTGTPAAVIPAGGGAGLTQQAAAGAGRGGQGMGAGIGRSLGSGRGAQTR